MSVTNLERQAAVFAGQVIHYRHLFHIAEVAAIRNQYASRTALWTLAELETGTSVTPAVAIGTNHIARAVNKAAPTSSKNTSAAVVKNQLQKQQPFQKR